MIRLPALPAGANNASAEVIDRIIQFSKTLKIKDRVDLRELIEKGRE